MNRTPQPPAEQRDGHAIVQARRRATVARTRFERELAALIDDLHAMRETIHGHPLPYDGTARDGQHEERQ